MMPEFKEGSGIHVDVASKTVVLIGHDMIDHVTGLVDGPLDESTVEALALGVVHLQYPGLVSADDSGWSLGAEPGEIEYLLSKLSPELGPVEFLSDGGVNGTV